jgi:5'(3')-deoxyribonucleotidase
MEFKKILYIDMDGVLVDFASEMNHFYESYTGYKNLYKKNPDEIPNIFKSPLPIPGAIDAVKMIAESNQFEILIATTSPWNNHDALIHKRLWIEKYFGDLFKKKMVITHRKDLLYGDYLIDDREANGAIDFKGELLSFGWAYEKNDGKGEWNEYKTWNDILKKLKIKVNY